MATMFPAPKTKNNPTLRDTLQKRADILQSLRHFFQERQVIEVETPLLGKAADPSPHLATFICQSNDHSGKHPPLYYLQTSPELAMKRLLVAGSGDIFQITKACRAGEQGRLHRPEFTLLEWYRLGFDHHQLMDETCLLLDTLLDNLPQPTRIPYATLFEQQLGLNPHNCNLASLQSAAQQADIAPLSGMETASLDDWLDLLFSCCIQSHLDYHIVYDYPASQAMLARLSHDSPPVAQRFEVFIQGVELANGFHELADAQEQKNRFLDQQTQRQQKGLAPVLLDYDFLNALEQGLPDCAGIALGIDRLVMLAAGRSQLSDLYS